MNEKNNNTIYKATTQLEQTLIQRVEELEKINLRLQGDVEARDLAQEGLRYGQKFLREVISSVEDTYFTVFDRNCVVNFIWSPKKLREKYGIIFQDYMGKDSNDFNPSLAKKIRQVFETNQSFHGEWYADRQGKRIWWDFTLSPIRDEDNEMVAVVSATRDVTKRKEMEEKLKESEEILRSTLESVVEGILVVNENGQVTHFNSKFISMWRIPQELIDEKDDQKLINYVLNQLKDPEAFQSKVEELYRSRNEDVDTLYFKDGRIFDRSSNPLTIGEEICGRVWSFRDITERKKMEEKLRESEKMYRDLVEKSDDLIILADLQGNLIYMNKAFLDATSYTEKEVLGTSGLNYVHPDDIAGVIGEMAKIADGKKIKGYNYRVKTKSNESVSVSLNGSPIFDGNGNVIQILGIGRVI
jgi:PAS domain S-box-containing protein